MYIVTAGKAFNDIDAFACAIAYAELLRQEGKDAQAVFLGPLNHSVTPLALEQGGHYLTAYTPTPADVFVYVDLSGPDHFAFADENESRIFEIYDHHYGFEAYWQERLGERAHIERVGAAATLIWEEYVKRGYADALTPSSANLLALAILQNTLNFTSTETNERDLNAFAEIGAHLTLPNGWQQRYFEEYATSMHARFDETMRNDTKTLEHFLGGKTLVFTQLEISEEPLPFLHRYRDTLNAYWAEFPEARGLVNIADIASKTSLLHSNDPAWLNDVLRPLFPDARQVSDTEILIPLHQRKQILKRLQDA